MNRKAEGQMDRQRLMKMKKTKTAIRKIQPAAMFTTREFNER